MLFLDHVVLAVRNLDVASKYLRDRFYLGTVEGGVHPEWGTGNVIVPLGDHFIEVVGITDLERAQSNPVGRVFLQKTKNGDKFLAPVLGSEDPDALSQRTGLSWASGERKTDRGILGFRSAGIERSMLEGEGWPYFFDYDDRVARLGYGDPKHGFTVRGGIKRIQVSQDAEKLSAFLGETIPELSVANGEPDVLSVTISTERGDLVLPGHMS